MHQELHGVILRALLNKFIDGSGDSCSSSQKGDNPNPTGNKKLRANRRKGHLSQTGT